MFDSDTNEIVVVYESWPCKLAPCGPRVCKNRLSIFRSDIPSPFLVAVE